MDAFFKKSILYDIYGGILSKPQRLAYEYHVIDDLSFTEIGDELGVTRQAAYDLYKNADKKLNEFEKKLGLKKRFENIESNALQILQNTNDKKIISLSKKIIENTNI